MTTRPMSVPNNHLDVLIIGLGFSGTYLLHNLLKLNYKVLAVDSAKQLGGVWNGNVYPGVRVDISVPSYQLNIPELHNREPWEWSEKFPSGEELRKYFAWLQERLALGRACEFGVWVEGATWIEAERLWEIEARDGRVWRARWLLPCLGYAASPLVPSLEGMESFQGEVVHSATWSQNIQLDGKRVGVVGTGASAVQTIQTIAPVVTELTVFQRTPATAVPMQQRQIAPGELTKTTAEERRAFLENRKTRWDGAPSSMIMRSAKEDSAAQREAEFERLWAEGGFAFWTSNYMDLFTDKESNDLIYDFWKRKVRARIDDAHTAELLAPDTSPYAFGTKRVPLEQNYYEAFNHANVSLVNIRGDPIKEITPTGVLLASGTQIDLDILVLATGFDISTGSFTQLDIRGVEGKNLAAKWSRRVKSFLGMSVRGFPNMLFPYGPQAPTNTCNGPVCAEIQGDFIIGMLNHARRSGITKLEAQREAEDEYTDLVSGFLKGSLFEGTESYYHRDNLPHMEGRNREPVFWMGGLPAYAAKLEECGMLGYAGFEMSQE